jgi:hypothetical protein
MITREKANEFLDMWRQSFGGVEATLNEPTPPRLGNRTPLIDFILGPRGFAWFEIQDGDQGHFAKADRILYDETFEMLTIEDTSKGWILEMQPLRTPEIVEFVKRWKEDHPNRVDVTRTLREFSE